MKLLIADDHSLFRETLIQYIQRASENIEAVAANDFYEVDDILSHDDGFDLVILDLFMPGMQKYHGFRVIQEHYPNVRVALMSGLAEAEHVHKAIGLGAVGYFPKTMSGKHFLGAIQTVLDGQKYIPQDTITETLVPSYFTDMDIPEKARDQSGRASLKEEVWYKSLTPREIEVLEQLGAGLSNKEIANALDVQEVTVKLHVRSICKKMNVKNRTQAALKAQGIPLEKEDAAE